jgi:hypothetical protein
LGGVPEVVSLPKTPLAIFKRANGTRRDSDRFCIGTSIMLVDSSDSKVARKVFRGKSRGSTRQPVRVHFVCLPRALLGYGAQPKCSHSNPKSRFGCILVGTLPDLVARSTLQLQQSLTSRHFAAASLYPTIISPESTHKQIRTQ